MLVVRERKDGFQMHGDVHLIGYTDIPSITPETSSEQFVHLREKFMNAFSESEHKNDEKISLIKDKMINRTIETIMEAERQNEQTIKDMIKSIPHYKGNAIPHYKGNAIPHYKGNAIPANYESLLKKISIAIYNYEKFLWI